MWSYGLRSLLLKWLWLVQETLRFQLKTITSVFTPSFQLLIRTLLPSPLNCLHQFIQLAKLLITHLVHRVLIQRLSFPTIPLKLLSILLPFRQEANYVKRVVDILVSPEFRFEVCVAEYTLFGTQLLPMGAEKTPVEWDRWEESEWW